MFPISIWRTVSIMCTACRARQRVLVVVVFLMLVILTYQVLVPQKVSQFPSWRNISLLQIAKMHLSYRPTQVGQAWACSKLTPPPVTLGDLNVSKIQFYEEARAKLSRLKAEDAWMEAFAPALSKQDKMTLLQTFAVFKTSMETFNLTYIIMHGSALGAWRHQGVTPWDDDIDIGIDVIQWMDIKRHLSCVQGYTLDATTNSKWAFYKSDGQWVGPGDKRWPFLDLFLYTGDDHYVWACNYVHLRKFVFPREDMFPLQLVPFEAFMVPVPRHLYQVLERQYEHVDMCARAPGHAVSTQLRHQTTRTPCSKLAGLYPMRGVRRTQVT